MREKTKKSLSENTRRLILFSAAFLAGAAIGGFFPENNADKLYEFRSSAAAWTIALSGLRGMFMMYAAFFLLGFSSVSLPFELFLPFFMGQGMGAVICGAYAGKGLLFALTLIPQTLVYAFSAALGARESLRMSEAVFKRTFLPDEYTPADIKLYIKKFAAIALIGLFAAAADALSALIFC